MEPSRLAELLAVLRDAGVSTARVPVADFADTPYLLVTFGPPAGTSAEPPDDGTEPAEEELPPGAFDPIARRRQLAKGG